jgi:lipoate-protein ligase A
MAIDETLFEGVQAGDPPVLRLYRWDPPTLSFGRNQLARGHFSASRAAERGIGIVRRPTGGAAVYHDKELTYSVCAPVALIGTPRAAYLRINHSLAAGLARLGVPARLGEGTRRRPSPDAAPCFQTAAAGEVAVGAHKLVGSAQRAERRTILQHGSILLEPGQTVVAELLDAPRHESGNGGNGSDGAVSLSDILDRLPAWNDLACALQHGFEEVLGIRLAPGKLSTCERERVQLLAEHYRSDAWTWRR